MTGVSYALLYGNDDLCVKFCCKSDLASVCGG